MSEKTPEIEPQTVDGPAAVGDRNVVGLDLLTAAQFLKANHSVHAVALVVVGDAIVLPFGGPIRDLWARDLESLQDLQEAVKLAIEELEAASAGVDG